MEQKIIFYVLPQIWMKEIILRIPVCDFSWKYIIQYGLTRSYNGYPLNHLFSRVKVRISWPTYKPRRPKASCKAPKDFVCDRNKKAYIEGVWNVRGCIIHSTSFNVGSNQRFDYKRT